MRIAIASDHAGFAYKSLIIPYLTSLGHQVRDFGTDSDAPCDYPVFIRPAAEAVARGECDRAVVLGGSGNGEAIVANKTPGVRCSYCFDLETARLGRAHNDANALAIGQRMVAQDRLLALVQMWLETPFDGGRHARRVAMIEPRGASTGSGAGVPPDSRS